MPNTIKKIQINLQLADYPQPTTKANIKQIIKRHGQKNKNYN